MSKRGIAEELRLRLLEKGFLSADEINASGLESSASLIFRWRRKKGMRIALVRKGAVWHGRILEQNYYVLADNMGEWIPEGIAETVETESDSQEQKDRKDKWEELKKRIVYDRELLCDTGNEGSTTYKVLVHVEKIMGELDFEEKGGPYK